MSGSQVELERIRAVVVKQGAQMVIAFNTSTKMLEAAQMLSTAATTPEEKVDALMAEVHASDERWKAIEAAYSVLTVNLQGLIDVLLSQAEEPGRIVGVTLLTETSNQASTQ